MGFTGKYRCHAIHRAIVIPVSGAATTQYIHILSEMDHFGGCPEPPGVKLKKVMLKTAYDGSASNLMAHLLERLTQMKVAGRNASVKNAIVFIAALSLCAAWPICTETPLSNCATVLKAF